MPSIKKKVEDWFCSKLNGNIPVGSGTLTFYPSRGDEDTQIPYGVVLAENFEETTPNTFVYTADLKIGIVTLIDDSSSGQFDELWEEFRALIATIPRQADEDGVVIFGYAITGETDARDDEDQSYANIMTFRIGCGG